MKVVRWANEHPISGAVLILSWVLTIAWWSGMDIDGLALDGAPLREQVPQLFSSALLHVDILHLLFNSYWVIVFTSWLERRLGWAATIGAIVLWAGVSGALEFAMFDGGVGLSGVGYAEWAFLSVARRTGRVPDAPGGAAIDRLFVVWFLLCIATTVTGLWQVGNIAHGAGAVIGGLCGLAWRGGSARRGESKKAPRYRWIAAATAFTVVAVLAATTLRPFVNLSRGYARNMIYAAWVANDRGDAREAERLLRLVLARDDGNAAAWTQLAHVLVGQDRDEELDRCCERALELAPGDPGVRRLLGWWRQFCAAAAWRRDDLRVALRLYEQSVEFDGTGVSAWTGLGMTRKALGDPDGARAAFSRAVQLDPSDALANDLIRALTK